MKTRNQRNWNHCYRIKGRAKRKGLEFALTFKDYKDLLQHMRCWYCKNGCEVKSIDRKNNNQGYTKENCVMACLKCNTLKSNKFTDEEFMAAMLVRRENLSPWKLTQDAKCPQLFSLKLKQ